MLIRLTLFLKNNPRYAVLCLGGLISSIGSGLTQVAIFGELAKLGATPFHFAAAFAFSLLPGLVSSRVGARLSAHYNNTHLLSFAELLGAVSILIPIAGIHLHSPVLLQFGQLVPAFVMGFSFPIIQKITRYSCSENDLAMATVFESYAFSLQVIFGIGIGTLLYGWVGAQTYFAIDIASYVASAIMIWFSFKNKYSFHSEKSDQKLPHRRGGNLPLHQMSASQKRAYILLPTLAVIGSPAMALLPLFGLKFGQQIIFTHFALTPVVLCLFAKSLGQLLGPLLIPPKAFKNFFENKHLFWLCSAGFVLLYFAASFSPSLLVLMILVVAAHVMSNIIYIVASFALKSQFCETKIASVSANQYQLQLFMMSAISFIAGQAAEFILPGYIIVAALPLAFLVFRFSTRCTASTTEVSEFP